MTQSISLCNVAPIRPVAVIAGQLEEKKKEGSSGFPLTQDSYSQHSCQLCFIGVLPFRPAPLYVPPADRCCVLVPVSSVTELPAADAVGDGRQGNHAGRQQMETEEVRILQHAHTHTHSSLSHTHTYTPPACSLVHVF